MATLRIWWWKLGGWFGWLTGAQAEPVREVRTTSVDHALAVLADAFGRYRRVEVLFGGGIDGGIATFQAAANQQARDFGDRRQSYDLKVRYSDPLMDDQEKVIIKLFPRNGPTHVGTVRVSKQEETRILRDIKTAVADAAQQFSGAVRSAEIIVFDTQINDVLQHRLANPGQTAKAFGGLIAGAGGEVSPDFHAVVRFENQPLPQGTFQVGTLPRLDVRLKGGDIINNASATVEITEPVALTDATYDLSSSTSSSEATLSILGEDKRVMKSISIPLPTRISRSMLQSLGVAQHVVAAVSDRNPVTVERQGNRLVLNCAPKQDERGIHPVAFALQGSTEIPLISARTVNSNSVDVLLGGRSNSIGRDADGKTIRAVRVRIALRGA